MIHAQAIQKEQKDKQQNKDSLHQRKKQVETMWRLTAPVHVTMSSFREHQRLEAYYEQREYGNIFQCDRLLKLETVYGRIQMGYNPNKRRSFLFVHMKNNLYDTVSAREQRSMKEYQQSRILRQEDNSHAYVAKRRNHAAVLLEKEEYKPWAPEVLRPYLKQQHMEAVHKTMPFLQAEKERSEIKVIHQEIRRLQEQVRENSLQGRAQENAALHQQIRVFGQETEFLQAICYRKDQSQRGFFRKLNYAFDIEKKAMFEYYREQRRKAEREESADMPRDEDGESWNTKPDSSKGNDPE